MTIFKTLNPITLIWKYILFKMQNLLAKTRTEKIERILQQRHPLRRKIETIRVNLRSLSSSLDTLAKHRDRLLEEVIDVDEYNRLKHIKQIDCWQLKKNIETELAALDLLKNRFDRDTINIGVIGRARQGKSRLLQSLTGLSTDEIPTGDRQHCTGVRSTIKHQPNVDTYGQIWFHSANSFLTEVIAPYYEELSLGAKPILLDVLQRIVPMLK